jgi:hypothetical protein
MKLTYRVLIKPHSGEEYMAQFTTDDIDRTMEQYQRNRPAFTYEILINHPPIGD